MFLSRGMCLADQGGINLNEPLNPLYYLVYVVVMEPTRRLKWKTKILLSS